MAKKQRSLDTVDSSISKIPIRKKSFVRLKVMFAWFTYFSLVYYYIITHP